MIPVSIQRTSWHRVTPTFVCLYCKGEFRIRHTKAKRVCVDCDERKDQAKRRAAKRVGYAIKIGKILRPTNYECVDCGAPATRYDHRNYGKPLEVEPVCCRCNARRGPALLGDAQ